LTSAAGPQIRNFTQGIIPNQPATVAVHHHGTAPPRPSRRPIGTSGASSGWTLVNREHKKRVQGWERSQS